MCDCRKRSCRCVEIEGRGEGKAGPKVGGTAGPADRSLGKRTAKPRLVVPPKLLLAIEKDKSLRDRLKKYGLPIKGSRQVGLHGRGHHLLALHRTHLLTS